MDEGMNGVITNIKHQQQQQQQQQQPNSQQASVSQEKSVGL
jgi:hypothetical protein